MDFKPLTYIYRPSGIENAYTLLLLHGTGGNENDLIPLAENFGKHYNLLSVRGNVSENGMPRFFKRLGMGVFDEQDLHFRTDELVDFINQLVKKEGFDPEKIIALGYSNGANIAGATLLKYPGFLVGAILYRPMQPFKAFNTEATAAQIPVLFTSGKDDGMVSPAATESYVKLLATAGYKVQFNELPNGHNLVQQDVALGQQWLEANFS